MFFAERSIMKFKGLTFKFDKTLALALALTTVLFGVRVKVKI